MKKMGNSWFTYIPWFDKEISILDKFLYLIYVFSALLIPISVLISLIIIYKVRKKHLHERYIKATTFVVVFIGVLSFIYNLIKLS